LSEYCLSGPRWAKISAIREQGGKLYLLDQERRILEYDPACRGTREVVRSGPGQAIRAFDVTPEGRIYVADGDNRIWLGSVTGAWVLGAADMELFFANRGEPVEEWMGRGLVPKDGFFPMPFDDARFSNIVGVRYVERYDGLLVQEDDPPGKEIPQLTERIHLRLLRGEDRLIYPWVKPMKCERYYVMENIRSQSLVSRFHEGSLAVDQQTATLFYLERNRSRLYHIGDGVWGLAKVGTISPPFGTRGSEYVLANARPDRHLHQRLEPLARRGPYLGMLMASSMLTTSNLLPTYSLGRELETQLRDEFGYRDGVRVELLCRNYASMKMHRALEAFETYVDTGARLDFLMIEIYADEQCLVPMTREEEMLDYLERLGRVAEQYDTRVFFINNVGMYCRRREGLRETPEAVKRFIEVTRRAGYPVLELTDPLIRDSLEVFPWGCPPYEGHHGSPMAIDASARLIASQVYPLLKSHFQHRLPAIDRLPATPSVPVDPADLLSTVFTWAKVDWEQMGLLRTDLLAMQKAYANQRLSIFVDLNRVASYRPGRPESQLDWIALSVLYQNLVKDIVGRRTTRVTLSMATFANYDEYGEGVLDSAEILYEKTLNRSQLQTYVIQVLGEVFGR